MPLHFTSSEFDRRLAATRAAMAERGLDGLILFQQESLYWLTGYDTFGYVFFQGLWLGADGRMALMTRAPDLRQARFTSLVEDVRVWADGAGADPYRAFAEMLRELGAAGGRVGVEWHAYGLTAREGQRLAEALDGLCRLEDASELVSRLRLVKSQEELVYVRRAAELADSAYRAALDTAAPGVDEGEILAAMQAAIWRGGGDDPANEQIIGSGPGALMCRYFTGRRRLDAVDQLTLEFAGVFRHYHAALMRTIPIGRPPDRQLAMHDAALSALSAATDALVPGRPLGDVFEAHARALDRAGFSSARMNACGYSLGATFAPNWMDFAEESMFFAGNPTVARPGMVFFIHIIIFDSDAPERPGGLAMTTGHTVLVGETGAVPLTRAPLGLIGR